MPKRCLSILANTEENGSRVYLFHHRYVVAILQYPVSTAVLATLCMQAVEFSTFECFFLLLETEKRNSEAVCQCSVVQNAHTHNHCYRFCYYTLTYSVILFGWAGS